MGNHIENMKVICLLKCPTSSNKSYQLLVGSCFHGRCEPLVVIPPHLFGTIHSDVSVLEQGIRICTIIGIDGNPYAGSGAEFMILNQKRFLKRFKDLSCNLGCIVYPGYVWHEKQKLIPSPQRGRG